MRDTYLFPRLVMLGLHYSSIYASSIHPVPSITWTATSTSTAKPMSRIPASLLYLTVYNPTLKPTGPIPDDDEDAEEQAQILFYTARDRAVSRDRMLRQVGLAKALVNFTECVCLEWRMKRRGSDACIIGCSIPEESLVRTCTRRRGG